MNYNPSSPLIDQLLSKTREPDEYLDQLARSVIGAAIEVHRHLGPGLQEPLYAPAVHIELSLRGIPFQSELLLPVSYKGRPLGFRKMDLLVGERRGSGAEVRRNASAHPLSPIDLLSQIDG